MVENYKTKRNSRMLECIPKMPEMAELEDKILGVHTLNCFWNRCKVGLLKYHLGHN